MHFVFRGKNAGNFELVECTKLVLNFLRHLCFTHLRIPVVIFGRTVGIASQNKRMPKWICFIEKVDQELVVSFTTD